MGNLQLLQILHGEVALSYHFNSAVQEGYITRSVLQCALRRLKAVRVRHCELLGCLSTDQKTPQGCRVLQAPLLCLGSQIERKLRVWSRLTEQLSVQEAAAAQSAHKLATRPGRAPRPDACAAKAELIQPEGENAETLAGTSMRDPTWWSRHEKFSLRVHSQDGAAPPPHANILSRHPTLKQGHTAFTFDARCGPT